MALDPSYQLDHVIVFVDDLPGTEQAFTDHLGLQITSHADHPGFGTRNAAIAFQLGFFELLTEDKPVDLRSSRYGRLFLERHERRGNSPAVFVFQTQSFDDVIAQCLARGGSSDFQVGYSRGVDGIAHEWKAALMPGTEPVYLDPRLPVLGRARTRPPKTPGVHPLGVRRIESIVIAARDLDATVELYRVQLGLTPASIEARGGVRTARFPLSFTGQQAIVVSPETTRGDVAEQLTRRGEGIFAVGLSVDDLGTARRDLERRGARPRDVEWLAGLPMTDPDVAANTRVVLSQA
jgi:catechol 2,3-dioxygenase-like lactoylglutathione lyase family enzyme